MWHEGSFVESGALNLQHLDYLWAHTLVCLLSQFSQQPEFSSLPLTGPIPARISKCQQILQEYLSVACGCTPLITRGCLLETSCTVARLQTDWLKYSRSTLPLPRPILLPAELKVWQRPHMVRWFTKQTPILIINNHNYIFNWHTFSAICIYQFPLNHSINYDIFDKYVLYIYFRTMYLSLLKIHTLF